MIEFLFLLVLMLLGSAFRHYGVLEQDSSRMMNQLIIYLALPALILTSLPKLSWAGLSLTPVIVPWAIFILMLGLILTIHYFFKLPRQTLTLALLLGLLGNTSFVGIPMVSTLIGEQALPYALLYDQLGSFIALSTGGVFICAIAAGEQLNVRAIALRILKFPPFWALLIALALPAPLSGAPEKVLQQLAALLLPLALLSVGLQFKVRIPRDDSPTLVFVLILKLIISPLIALFLCLQISEGGIVAKTVGLEAAMGPMISAGILAMEARLNPNLVGSIVAWGLLLSFITVPLWFFILNGVF